MEMNILTWNGLNSSSRVSDAKRLIKDQSVGLFASLETKVKSNNINRILGSLGMHWQWVNNLVVMVMVGS